MALAADPSTFAEFLWLRGDALTPEAIAEHVIRHGPALGPVALGDLEPDVQERLDRKNLPANAGGYKPQLEPEHHTGPGYGNGTEAWKLTSTGELFERLQGPRQGFLEWSIDVGEPRPVVLVRYCVGWDAYNGDDGTALHAALRDALTRAHGPGTEHKKKHARARLRSTSWAIADAHLTLGMYLKQNVRLVVIELVAAAWKDRECLRLEVLQ